MSQRQQYQYQNSPTGSTYNRNDEEGENYNVNNSISLKPPSQRVAINIDDIPITTTKARNFEELLEKNLRQMEGSVEEDAEAQESNTRHQKKEFLKRKVVKSSAAAQPTKKYNYYVDNFEESKEKEKVIEKVQEQSVKRKERQGSY
jgi:hypothetical protein